MAGAGTCVGIDVGGSGTRAMLADTAGSVLSVGHGPAGNHQVVGWAGTRSAVEAALSGFDLSDLTTTHVGASGADFPEDLDALRELLGHLPGLTVENDALLGLHAATHDGVGLAIVAGSGCNAVARGLDGRPHTVGGVGWHCGDVGGAWQLGTEAVRLALRSAEGREVPSTLTRRCWELAGVADHAALLRAVGTWTGPDALLVAAAALEEAADGDPLALTLVEHYGTELGLAGGLALGRAGLRDVEGVPVVVLGGLVAQSVALTRQPLLDALAAELWRHAPGARLIPWDGAPVVGALAAALRSAGHPADVAALQAHFAGQAAVAA